DRQGEGATLNNLATTAHAKGDYDTALSYLEKSLKIQQEIGDINGMATTLTNMGAMLFEQQRFEEAIALLMPAYQIFEKIGSPNKQAPGGYLGAIIKKIGETRFAAIINKLNQNS
ncbi:MAG: tetratricopeptide repeat protein, partial [Phaeodactylibacter sp.]|nr:tetratricopeptide repeat protein [Phaeodactylibacter sp.]